MISLMMEQREALLEIGLHNSLPRRHEVVNLELSGCLNGVGRRKQVFMTG